MIAMVAYLFLKADVRSLSQQQAAFVEKWFWKAAFSQHYGASTLTLMGSDRIDYFDSAVEGKTVEPNYPITLTPQDLESLMIHTRSAVKNAILCLLALRAPRHFKNGSVIALDKKICSEYNSPEKHHIFPKKVLARLHVKQRHLLANFAFIPGELNREISASKPSEYFSEFKRVNTNFDEVLESHLIPHGQDSPIWKDDYEAFVKVRIGSVFHEIEKVAGKISPLEAELEKDPNSVVDRLEAETRTYVDGVLTERIGENYWAEIPQGTRELVGRRQAERVRRHPYEQNDTVTNYERLTFCDIMDYEQIVLKNWQHFEGTFGSRFEVQKHFLGLKEYRNAVKHGREMNTVERKQGEASVEWLFRILERARKQGSDLEEGASPADAAGPNGQTEVATGNDEKRKPVTIEDLLAKTTDPQARDRINEVMRFCENFPNVERYLTQHHIVYTTTRAFARIYPQRYQFWVDVLRKGVDDPNHLLRHQNPVYGHIQVPKDLDLQKVKDLVEQSYKSTTPGGVHAS
jgi:hypothetical protein